MLITCFLKVTNYFLDLQTQDVDLESATFKSA